MAANHMSDNSLFYLYYLVHCGFTLFHVLPSPPAPPGDGQNLHIVGVKKFSNKAYGIIHRVSILESTMKQVKDFPLKNCGQGLKFPPFYAMFRDHVR